MVTCSKCGTKNQKQAEFCTNCGVSLFSPKRSEIRKDKCFGKEKRDRDYMGFISFGSFLIIIGIIISVNTSVFSNFLVWLNQLTNGKVWIRPSEDLITSVTLFFGLLGISNFFIAALKLIFNRSKRRGLSDIFSGIALILFAYMFNLYNDNVLRLRMILAIEVIICGLLIILYSILWYMFYKPDS